MKKNLILVLLSLLILFTINCHTITYSAKDVSGNKPVSFHRGETLARGLFTAEERQWFLLFGLISLNDDEAGDIIKKYVNKKYRDGRTIRAIQKVQMKTHFRLSDFFITGINGGIIWSTHTMYIEGELIDE
jgi:hypothetical protein